MEGIPFILGLIVTASPERSAKTFKNRFNYMMYVPSVKSVDMERYAAVTYESLKEVFYKVRVKVLQFAFFSGIQLYKQNRAFR